MAWPVCWSSADGPRASGPAITPSIQGPGESPATGAAHGRACAPCRNTPICNSKCDGRAKVPCPAAPPLLMSASGRLVTWLIQFVGRKLQAAGCRRAKNNRYKRVTAIEGRRHISTGNGRRDPILRQRCAALASRWLGSGRMPAIFFLVRLTNAATGSSAELLN